MVAKNFSANQDKDGIYHLQGEISIHELDGFRAFLEKTLKSKQKQEIVLSLAEVEFIDTAALQLLIAFKRWLEPDAKLKISALSVEVEDILSLCSLKTALL